MQWIDGKLALRDGYSRTSELFNITPYLYWYMSHLIKKNYEGVYTPNFELSRQQLPCVCSSSDEALSVSLYFLLTRFSPCFYPVLGPALQAFLALLVYDITSSARRDLAETYPNLKKGASSCWPSWSLLLNNTIEGHYPLWTILSNCRLLLQAQVVAFTTTPSASTPSSQAWQATYQPFTATTQHFPW